MARGQTLHKIFNLLGPALGLVLVLAIFSLLSYRPDRGLEYLSAANIKQVAIQTAILAICGIGMTMEYSVGHYFKRLTAIDIQFGDADTHLRRLSEAGGLIAAAA